MKVLHIGLYWPQEPQHGLRTALKAISTEYRELSIRDDVITRMSPADRAEYLKRLGSVADLVFLQVQRPNVITVDMAKAWKAAGAYTFNFTGDVRQPLPQWYVQLAPFVHSLFTNERDVAVVRAAGHVADFIPMGFDHRQYTPSGHRAHLADIVFMGNHYAGMFPLSNHRQRMVQFLQGKYGKRFRVFGSGWGTSATNLMYKQDDESAVYRGCKIAINQSHFQIERYSSGRITRLMGSGAFCLAHEYPMMEKDYKNGEHLVSWSTFDDLKRLIDYYLNPAHDEERLSIARAGCYRVRENFTWYHLMTRRVATLVPTA